MAIIRNSVGWILPVYLHHRLNFRRITPEGYQKMLRKKAEPKSGSQYPRDFRNKHVQQTGFGRVNSVK
jgi:hypothetical protein